MPDVNRLDHLVITARDMTATIRFYCDVLGMQNERFAAGDGTQRVALVMGLQKINLHDAAEPFAPHAAKPTPVSQDLCLLTEDPLEDWLEHLKARETAVVEGPVARTGALGPIRSLYVRDPDGNLIEIARYEPDD